MRRRSMAVLLACVALAVMTGQLRPTNDDTYTHPDPRLAQVFFPTLPSTTTSTVLP